MKIFTFSTYDSPHSGRGKKVKDYELEAETIFQARYDADVVLRISRGKEKRHGKITLKK